MATDWRARHWRGNTPSFVFSALNGFIMMLAQQQATWTSGPSLPNHNPEDSAKLYPHHN